MKKAILIAGLSLVSCFASAEGKPFLNLEAGIADTDYDNGFIIAAGLGYQFNDNFEFEVNYNNFGDVGPFGLEITSFSYALNIGGQISEKTRLFGILGSERLEADDSVSIGPYTIDVNESSTEAFFGLGTAYENKDNVEVRTKLISHDSGEILTFSVGVAVGF
ncbi:MAG: outer membrane beta-barrel protein [Cellvibrionaceae bacterium]